MKEYYRLVYRDGSHGAWTTDLEWLKECAKKFHAIIQKRG